MEKIIHQIWVGPHQMPDREVGFVESMKTNNPDFEHILWTDKNLPELHPSIMAKVEHFKQIKIYAFAADVLRVALVYEYGGIYADVDLMSIKGFGDLMLENYNGLIVLHNGHYTAGNDFFGCKSKFGFIKHAYEDLVNDQNHGHDRMPYWFNKQVRNHYDVLDIEHYTLRQDEVEATGKEIVEKIKLENTKLLMRHGEWEKIYCSHYGLFSWAECNRKNFEEGNINYTENN